MTENIVDYGLGIAKECDRSGLWVMIGHGNLGNGLRLMESVSRFQEKSTAACSTRSKENFATFEVEALITFVVETKERKSNQKHFWQMPFANSTSTTAHLGSPRRAKRCWGGNDWLIEHTSSSTLIDQGSQCNISAHDQNTHTIPIHSMKPTSRATRDTLRPLLR